MQLGAIRLDLSELLKSAKYVKDIVSSSIVLGLCNVIMPCLLDCSALPFSIQNGLDWNLCHTAHFPVVDG